MPLDPVLTRQHVIEADGPVHHDQVILEKYEAPAGSDGLAAEDPHKDYDMWVARRAMALLKAAYPGHFWCVVSDAKHHILKISIPVLMGVCHWYVINLRTHEMVPRTVILAGGEILERYGLTRGALQEAAFLDARARHSALVVPTRRVPG